MWPRGTVQGIDESQCGLHTAFVHIVLNRIFDITFGPPPEMNGLGRHSWLRPTIRVRSFEK